MLRRNLDKTLGSVRETIGPKEEMLSKHNTRTPHASYAKYEKQKGSSRSVAWNKLKQFAMESKGEKKFGYLVLD